MKKAFLAIASVTALALTSATALAQESGSSSTGQNMKGPPNADGYKNSQGEAASGNSEASKGSSEKMKGPPNANGASSDK